MDKLPFRSVLVTGGDGFVGSLLVTALTQRLAPDARLVLMGRRQDERAPAVSRIVADVRDAAQVNAAVCKVRPDLVLHLAAQSSVAQAGGGGAGETWAINFGGSLHLAQACVEHGFDGTFLFVSSAEVYGRSFVDGPVHEASALAPQSAYGRSKAAAEAMLADVLPAAARLVVARPGNHSGPGQDTRFVLPSFAAQIAAIEAGSGAETLQVGNLEAERDFLDVRDVIGAYLAILDRAGTLDRRVTFNISSSRTFRISDLLDRLRGLSSRTIAVEQDPARLRPSDIPRAEINADAIRRATGWHPEHSIDSVLRALLEHERHSIG